MVAAKADLGPVHGVKMVKGYLKGNGIVASHKRIAGILKAADPAAAAARTCRRDKRANPIPYHAAHFGDKLHIDQNEKLIMFGVCHVAGIDGATCKIVSHQVFPEKNCRAIYEDFFVPILQVFPNIVLLSLN